MTSDDIDFCRLNKLISLKLSNSNIAKRLNRAKYDKDKKGEYILLSIVKGLRNLEEVVYK